MNLPPWVQETVEIFQPPKTGLVIIELECYQGGITKLQIGSFVRIKPDGKNEMQRNELREKIA